MRYQDAYGKILPKMADKGANSVEEVLDVIMNVQRKSVSVKELNEGLRKAGYKGKLLDDKFSPEEKAARAALGKKLREKIIRNAGSHYFTEQKTNPLIREKIKVGDKNKTSSGDRYVEELLFDRSGTPESLEKNAEISALFIDADAAALHLAEGQKNPYEQQINQIHGELVGRLEKYDVDDLVSRDLSDEELIENFDLIETCKGFCMQIQNIEETYKRMKIPMPEDLKNRMEALKPAFRVLEKHEQRLSRIDSPYYAEIDPDDPAILEIHDYPEIDAYLDQHDVPAPESFGVTQGEFELYVLEAGVYQYDYAVVELDALSDMMKGMGVEHFDIMAQIDDKPPQNVYDPQRKGSNTLSCETLRNLESGKIKNLRLFDKNNPAKEIIVPKNSGNNHLFSRMLMGKQPQPPQPPREVPRPNGFKRFLNRLFGAFKKEVNAYKQYQKDAEAYPAKLEKYENQKKVFDKFKEQKAEIDKLRDIQPSKSIKQGIEQMLSAYSNNPKYLPQNKGFYEGMEEGRFSELESFDIQGMTVGGEQVTEMEFAALAMAGAMQPGSGATNQIRHTEDRENYDEDYLSTSNATMYTADIALGRDKCIGHFFDGIKNGRIAAQQALQDYKNGDPEKMADLLANGMVKFEAWIRELGTGTASTVCSIEFFSKMAGLIEKDEALKNLVGEKMEALRDSYAEKEKEFGEKQKAAEEKLKELSKDVDGVALPGSEYDKAMEEYEVSRTAYDHYRGLNAAKPSLTKAMKDMKAYRKVNELNEKANEARETIKKAAISGKELEPKVKKQCLKDILRVASMDACLKMQRNDSQAISEKFLDEKQSLLMKGCKARSHILGAFMTAIQAAESKPVSIMQQLSEEDGLKNLDAYAEGSVKPETMQKWINTPEKDLLAMVDHTKMSNAVRDDKMEIGKVRKTARENEMQKQAAMEKQKEALTGEKVKAANETSM